MPLKNVPPVLTPDLLCALASMGQGEDIVVGDANFPTKTVCESGPIEIRADGVNTVKMIDAILKLMPLHVEDSPRVVPVKFMTGIDQTMKHKYLRICRRNQGSDMTFKELPKDAFIERAKRAFVVVHTRETSPRCSIIMMKGIVSGVSDTSDTKGSKDTNDTEHSDIWERADYSERIYDADAAAAAAAAVAADEDIVKALESNCA